MAQLVRMKLDNQSTILVEAAEEGGLKQVSKTKKILEITDKIFDRVVQHEIVENCKVLIGAFEELKSQPIPPSKAIAEFGLQLTGEGDIYVVKASGQASFKISVEWEFPK